MLTKLITQEYKDTFKTQLFLCFLAFFSTILFFISLYLNTKGITHSTLSTLLIIGGGLFWFAGIMIATIGCYANIFIHFYKTCFSKQGYFTFTLPATSGQIFFSKFLVSYFWQLLMQVVVFLNVFGLIYYFTDFNSLSFTYSTIVEILQTAGFTWGSLAILVLSYITTTVSFLLLGFASICLGQLWTNHKIPFAIFSYIGINIIIQTISNGFSHNIYLDESAFFIYDSYIVVDPSLSSFFNQTILLNSGLSFVCIILSYIVCHYIMKNKVNLI